MFWILPCNCSHPTLMAWRDYIKLTCIINWDIAASYRSALRDFDLWKSWFNLYILCISFSLGSFLLVDLTASQHFHPIPTGAQGLCMDTFPAPGLFPVYCSGFLHYIHSKIIWEVWFCFSFVFFVFITVPSLCLRSNGSEYLVLETGCWYFLALPENSTIQQTLRINVLYLDIIVDTRTLRAR